jgi:hypothetical protein
MTYAPMRTRISSSLHQTHTDTHTYTHTDTHTHICPPPLFPLPFPLLSVSPPLTTTSRLRTNTLSFFCSLPPLTTRVSSRLPS